MKIIGIDVDNVIVNSGLSWFEWAELNFGVSIECKAMFIEDTKNGHLDFSHAKYFPHVALSTLLSYWSLSDIYDNITPDEDAVRSINELQHNGCEILFISHVLGDHGFSKEKMLNRSFNKKPKHMWTEHKQFARVTHMIDDRLKNFIGFPEDTSLIHFKTAYIESCDEVSPHLHTNCWNSITSFILG